MKQALLLLVTASLIYSQSYDIYVSDAGNFNLPPWQILKFDGDGQNPETFITDFINWPQDILFQEESNTVLISNLGSNRITRHDATTGAFMNEFTRSVSGPTRMKIGPDSLLYVLQWNSGGIVKRFSLSGTALGNFTSVGVPQSIGLDWDTSGNLYVSSYTGDLVRKFDPEGNDLGIFIDTDLLGPTNIWFDDNGDLLVVDYNGTSVKRFDTTGTYLGDFITGLGQGEGLAFLPDGNILIGNGGYRSVKEFDSEGNFVQDLIPSGSGGLMTPNAIVLRVTEPVSVANPLPAAIDFALSQNYPNPFNPNTTIQYHIPETALVQMTILDMMGRSVDRLFAGLQSQGHHSVQWDGTDSHGNLMGTGTYFLKMEAAEHTRIIKLVLLR